MGSHNYGIKSSYLKSKIGGVITDFKSNFLIVAISTVNCSLLQVFAEGEISAEIAYSNHFYQVKLNGTELSFVDCSNVINRNLEDIVLWLNAYPTSLIAHVNIDELDEILGQLKHSASIPNKVLKAM